MPIFAKAGATFIPASAGQHAGVCIDVIDLGLLKIDYKGKTKDQHKVKIRWQIEELRDNGRAYHVEKLYTLSLHEKAALRKDLESWRGKPFTEQELQGFDLEVLIGKPALLNVMHNVSNGNTWANVSTLMRLPKGMTAPTAESDYVRMCDRPPEDAGAEDKQNYTDNDMPPGWDDSVPF